MVRQTKGETRACFLCKELGNQEKVEINLWQCLKCGIYLHEKEAIPLMEFGERKVYRESKEEYFVQKCCIGITCPNCKIRGHFKEL